jgi:ech hydrogenase subunit A
MEELSQATLLLIVSPLAGACLLLLEGRHRDDRAEHPTGTIVAGITIATILVTCIALVLALGVGGVVGAPVQQAIGLGFLDPGQPAGSAVLSTTPLLLSFIFVAIAIRAHSRSLAVLALTQLALAGVAARSELATLVSPDGHETAGPALLLDPLAGLLLMVSVLVGGLIAVYALGYEPGHLTHRGLPSRRVAAFLAWLFIFLGSMNLLVLSDDLRLLTIAWELTTLCSFLLIGFDGDGAALAGARRALAYNIGGGIAMSAAVIAAGPGATISGLLSGEFGSATLMPLILAGLIVAAVVKSALMPFQPWLLGAMVAAAPVSALLHASTMVAAGSYLLLRLSPAIATEGLMGPALALFGGVSFAGAALMAMRERDLKRVLAYSTVSSLGLVASAVGLGSPAALAAGTLLLAFHAVAKAAAFLSVGTIEQLSGTRDSEALVGVGRRRPGVAALLLLAAAALTLPPFGIVVAKWALLVLGASDITLVVLLALGGAANLALWTGVASRILVRRDDPGAVSTVGRLPGSERFAMAALGVATLGGFVLAAAFARAIADPAAAVAFGRDAGLAAGWSITLTSAGFAVPAIGLLTAAAAAVGLAVAGRVRNPGGRPYLAGANMPGSGPAAFHGARGGAVTAMSGGFYWEGARDGTVPRTDMRRVVPDAAWVTLALVLVSAMAAAGGMI